MTEDIVKRGPICNQPREELCEALGWARCRVSGPGNFMTKVYWGALVAVYEKALGKEITPCARLGDTDLDFSTAKIVQGQVQMGSQRRRMTITEAVAQVLVKETKK